MDESYSYSIQIIGLVFSITMLTVVFFLVKSRLLQERYSIIWFFVGAFVLVISLFREFIDWFSAFIGIYYAPSAFFSILIVFLYILLLNLSVSVSKAKRQIKNLVQEVGLLKLKVEEMESRLSKENDNG